MEKITKATYKRPLHPNGDKFTMVPARVGHLNEVIDSVNNLDKEYYITGYFQKTGSGSGFTATVKDHNTGITNLQFSLSVQNLGGSINYQVFLGRYNVVGLGTVCETADGPITITGMKMNSFSLFPTYDLIDRGNIENKQVVEIVSIPDYDSFNFTSTTPILSTFRVRGLNNGSWGYITFPAPDGFQDYMRFEIRFSNFTYTQQ
jgi:hypothetical protein